MYKLRWLAPVLAVASLASCEDRKEPALGAGGADVGFPGLTAPVEIVRDEEGVIHVYAERDADAFYGSGYAQATDRLLQMDLMRRQALGRRAEVLGPGAVGDDRLLRVLRMPDLGRANAERARRESPEGHLLIEAWTAGVNARIAEVNAGDAPLPVGFTELGYAPEAWDVSDAYTIGKAIVFQNGNQLEFDLLASLIDRYEPGLLEAAPFFSPIEDAFVVPRVEARSAPLPPRRATRAVPPLPPDAEARLRAFVASLAPLRPGASNNWAVSGAHTENGRSLLAGDPHQPLRSPSIMWIHHMHTTSSGGTLDVAGWTFVGTPGVSLGHNRNVAWTATTNYPDVTDVFDVEVTDGAVRLGGALVPLDVREEQILVKGEEPVELRLEAVPEVGVLLPEDIVPLPLTDAGRRLFLRWTGFTPTAEAAAFFRFDQAADLDAFEAGVDAMELGSFNFVAATADDVTYRSSPRVPRRADAAARPPYLVLDGDDPETNWTGSFLGPDELPHQRGAGPAGFLSTANNDPFGFTGDGSFANDPFYFGAFFDPGTRAKRIQMELTRLVEEGDVDLAAMQALQGDSYSRIADQLLPLLAEVMERVPTDDALAAYRDRADVAELAAALAAWDRKEERDRHGAVAFEAFWAFYARRALADDMGIFFQPVFDSSPMYIAKLALLASRTADGELLQGGRDRLLLDAAAETHAWLAERFGVDAATATWGDFHRTRFPSQSVAAYDGGEAPTDGGEGTVNVSSGRFFDGETPVDQHRSSSGALYRMVATFDEDGVPRAYFNFAGGNTGEPGSAHFADLTEGWIEDEYVLLRFRDEDVAAGEVERVVLAP